MILRHILAAALLCALTVPAHAQSSFTQSGTGAVPVTYDALYRGIIVTPEMFGGYCGLGNDATAGIQRAIDYLASVAGGMVELSNCLYRTTAPLVIGNKGIKLRGKQAATGNGTEIYFIPGAAGQCAISLTAGTGILSDAAIESLSIRSPDRTTYKTGVCISDSSVVLFRDLFIYDFLGGGATAITGAVASPSGEIRLTVAGASVSYNTGWAAAVSGIVLANTVDPDASNKANSGWPIAVVGPNQIDLKGSTFTDSYVSGGTITASSTGLQVKGREFINTEGHVEIKGDLALRLSSNPNPPGGGLDQSNFNNLALHSTGTNPVIMVDDGTLIGSVKFSGTQSWHGGKDGFSWRDRSSTSIAEQVRFENVRAEQKSVSGGSYFNIRPNNLLYSLQIVNPLMDLRDGLVVRNTANLLIDGAHYIGTGKCIDLDATVVNTQINGSYWGATSTATLTGQNLLAATGKNPSTGCLPSFATYANAFTRTQLAGTDISGTLGVVGGVQSGQAGLVNGTLSLIASGTGVANIHAQTTQGNPDLSVPTNSGTLVASASPPIIVDPITGNATCPTCVTSAGGGAIARASKALDADIPLNNTGLFFDGPSMAQGTSGTWWATGTVTLTDTAGSAFIQCKLWDGSTVISSTPAVVPGASSIGSATLSGFLANPAGNIRMSCRDASSTSGSILFNSTGTSKDSTVYGFRIN
jgi:hypothetical protein